MNQTKTKWNRVYAEDRDPGSPSVVLTDNTSLLPTSGVALDLACGLGANSLFLAERGFEVHAWDISTVAISRLADRAGSLGLNIQTSARDIVPSALGINRFDLVITSHYLDRELPTAIKNATRPGGVICYQTFTDAKLVDIGPTNPDFLLRPNELQQFVTDCEVLAFKDESAQTDRNHPLAGRAYIIARKLSA